MCQIKYLHSASSQGQEFKLRDRGEQGRLVSYGRRKPRGGHKNDAGNLRGPCPVSESGSRDALGDAACSQVEDVGVGNGGSHRQATAQLPPNPSLATWPKEEGMPTTCLDWGRMRAEWLAWMQSRSFL